jgi:hypothetical protein
MTSFYLSSFSHILWQAFTVTLCLVLTTEGTFTYFTHYIFTYADL